MSFAGTSVTEFFANFPDEEACLRHIFEVTIGNHAPCPNCGKRGGWKPLRGTKKYYHPCRIQISPLMGTPFYRSNLSLMAWFYAMLLFTNSSTGVRSSFLRRQLGIGVKSAHRLCNEVRAHMATFELPRPVGGPDKLVHIDEAYIKHMVGGRRQRPHIVMGLECEGQVCCGILQDCSLPSIMAVISKLVRPGSILVTDCHLAYSGLSADGWEHIPINHSRAFHNFAGVTNNPIEVFWSVLKRTLRLYQHVAANNLWRFLAEVQFRYNRRFSETSTFRELIGAFPPLLAQERDHLGQQFDWSTLSDELG